MSAFQPKHLVPQWQTVLDLLEPLDVNDILTYAALNEALGVEDFRKNRTPLYRAAQEWGAARHRALEPVPNVGYRVAGL